MTLEATSLYSWVRSVSAGGASEPEAAGIVNTQANFFEVLGVHPFFGRGFAQSEDAAGKNHVAVLSYGFWQRHFAGDPKAIGKTVELNDEAYTVIGVMPRWFNFPTIETDIWTPFDMSPNGIGPRGTHSWRAVGRIRTNVTLAQARQDLLAISKRLEKDHKDTNDNVHAVLIPLKDTLVGDSRAALLILFGAVALVLLVACANVANLLLARATARRREMALRASLGASRLRLVRQLTTESVMLALAGAALGTLGAWWCVRLLESAKSIPVPRANPVQVDGMVLLFTIIVSVLAGVLFGLAPALQISGSNFNKELKAGAQAVLTPAGNRQRLRDALVVGEIAVTLALLAGAGLLLRSFAHLRSADIGVNPHNLLTMIINLPDAKYADLAARRQFFDELVNRVDNTPGVAAAVFSTEIPLDGGNNGTIDVDGSKDTSLSNLLVGNNYVTTNYFRTLGIPLLEGRNFTPADLDRTAAVSMKLFELYKATALKGLPMKVPPDLTLVAVISQDMARTFWRNQDPVGRSFHSMDVKVTVIGVVRNVREYGIRGKQMPQAYFPITFDLAVGGEGYLTVRTRVTPLAVLPAIRGHVHALDSGLAVFRAQTMEEIIADNIQDATVQTFLLGSFAVLALVLAAVGLYGVMAYLVTQRTREIGIRMAVGAREIDVLRLIMKHGAALTIAGLVIGLFAAIGLTRFLATLLYGVGATDPLTFACVAALLALVAFTAYYIPARRATRVDPMVALRYE